MTHQGSAIVYVPTTVQSEEAQRPVDVALYLFLNHLGPVAAVSWSPDGKLLAASSGREVLVWDVGRNRSIFTFRGHTALVRAVAFSPDGSLRIASGGDDRVLQVWKFEPQHNRILWQANSHNAPVFTSIGYAVRHEVHSIAWSPRGDFLLAGGEDTLRVFERGWSLDTQRLFTQGHATPVNVVIWSPSGLYVASAGYDETILVWASTGVPYYAYRGHNSVVSAMAWSPDNEHIVTAYEDGTVHVWRPSSPQERPVYHGHSGGVVTSVTWSPDSRLIASADKSGTMQVWDAASGALVFSYSVAGGPEERASSPILALDWSPDGKRIALGTENKTLQLLQVPPFLLRRSKPR